MSESMMIIREYASEMEAIVAQSVLKANNIPAAVLRDNAGSMLPVLHMLYPVRLAVHPADADLARELLDSEAGDSDAEGELSDEAPE